MRQKVQSGFWRGVGSVLQLVPPRPQCLAVYYHGRDLRKITASESLHSDWEAVFGAIVESYSKVELNGPSARETRLCQSGEATDADQRLATTK